MTEEDVRKLTPQDQEGYQKLLKLKDEDIHLEVDLLIMLTFQTKYIFFNFKSHCSFYNRLLKFDSLIPLMTVQGWIQHYLLVVSTSAECRDP